MASKSKSRTLTDHDEIRRWAEERDAKPAAVRTTRDDNSTGIIRLDFPGYSGGESLEEIEWDEWFQDFDDNDLALIVQDQTAEGEQSNFNKLVSRESVNDDSAEPSETDKPSAQKSASSKRSISGKARKQGSRKSSTKESPSATKKQAVRSRKSSEESGDTAHKKRSSRRKAA